MAGVDRSISLGTKSETKGGPEGGGRERERERITSELRETERERERESSRYVVVRGGNSQPGPAGYSRGGCEMACEPSGERISYYHALLTVRYGALRYGGPALRFAAAPDTRRTASQPRIIR
jgi:hypothetical protein